MAGIEKNRRDPVPLTGDVETVLPEYFTQDNSKLVSLLSLYETFLDSDNGAHDFNKKIQDVFASRDIPAVDADLVYDLCEVVLLAQLKLYLEVGRKVEKLKRDVAPYVGGQ